LPSALPASAIFAGAFLPSTFFIRFILSFLPLPMTITASTTPAMKPPTP
jgi:hypothetical protein